MSCILQKIKSYIKFAYVLIIYQLVNYHKLCCSNAVLHLKSSHDAIFVFCMSWYKLNAPKFYEQNFVTRTSTLTHLMGFDSKFKIAQQTYTVIHIKNIYFVHIFIILRVAMW